MNPFEDSASPGRFALLGRLGNRALLIVLLASLGIGFALVAWRTQAGVEARRAVARAEARAIANALELQLERAVAAAELVGAAARQTAGGLNFQKLAADVLSTRPGISSIDLQPGGIVSDVYPREGNERLIGFNSLKHPAYRPSALGALQKRSVTIAGPLRLLRGEAGLVAMVPVYARGREQAESFWGFVTASLSFDQMLARARESELSSRAYDSIIFTPPSAERPAVVLAASRPMPINSGVQSAVRAQNIDLQVAVRPRAGWVSKSELVLDCTAVVLISGLLSALTILLASRTELAAQCTKAQQQLASAAAARTQLELERSRAQETAASIQAELLQARAALQQNELAKADLQRRLDEAARTADAADGPAEQTVAEADRAAIQLRTQLNELTVAAQESAQSHKAERERAAAALGQAQQTIQELRTELEEAARSEKESVAAIQKHQQQDRAAIANLQGRLNRAIDSAAEAARTHQEERAQLEAALEEARQAMQSLQIRVDEANRQFAVLQAAAQTRPSQDQPGKADRRTPMDGARPEKSEPKSNEAAVPHPEEAQPATVILPASSQAIPREAPLPAERESEPKLPSQIETETTTPPTPEPAGPVSPRPARRKTSQPQDQMNLWGDASPNPDVTTESGPAVEASGPRDSGRAKEPKRALPKGVAAAPVPAAQELRLAFHQILPLLTDQDPGAADCLNDHRALFKSVFAAEDYSEFQEWINTGKFASALEHLKKAAKRYGVSL